MAIVSAAGYGEAMCVLRASICSKKMIVLLNSATDSVEFPFQRNVPSKVFMSTWCYMIGMLHVSLGKTKSSTLVSLWLHYT